MEGLWWIYQICFSLETHITLKSRPLQQTPYSEVNTGSKRPRSESQIHYLTEQHLNRKEMIIIILPFFFFLKQKTLIHIWSLYKGKEKMSLTSLKMGSVGGGLEPKLHSTSTPFATSRATVWKVLTCINLWMPAQYLLPTWLQNCFSFPLAQPYHCHFLHLSHSLEKCSRDEALCYMFLAT